MKLIVGLSKSIFDELGVTKTSGGPAKAQLAQPINSFTDNQSC